jgi:hypothetical protein
MNTHAAIKTTPSPLSPDREVIAAAIDRLDDADAALLASIMDNPAADDLLIDGLHRFLDTLAKGRFLNTLKLEQRGLWLGQSAPARLQIRLTEAARSSQHAAYHAFRTGLTRSGGLERAFPKA